MSHGSTSCEIDAYPCFASLLKRISSQR